MGHVEATRRLGATPHALWTTLTDPRTWDTWFTVHDRWLGAPPVSLEEGTRLTGKVVMLGVTNRIEWTVASAAVPRNLVLAGTGRAGMRVGCAFGIAPAGRGSRFTVAVDFRGALIGGAVVKTIERDALEQVEIGLKRLDALASARHIGASARRPTAPSAAGGVRRRSCAGSTPSRRRLRRPA
jgi:hypothetical protein